jgi:iron(III) transport system substrate-binding protein
LKVTWFQGGTEKVKTKIAGEVKAKKIGADVLMVADPSYYLTLKKQGLLDGLRFS